MIYYVVYYFASGISGYLPVAVPEKSAPVDKMAFAQSKRPEIEAKHPECSVEIQGILEFPEDEFFDLLKEYSMSV